MSIHRCDWFWTHFQTRQYTCIYMLLVWLLHARNYLSFLALLRNKFLTCYQRSMSWLKPMDKERIGFIKSQTLYGFRLKITCTSRIHSWIQSLGLSCGIQASGHPIKGKWQIIWARHMTPLPTPPSSQIAAPAAAIMCTFILWVTEADYPGSC